MDTENLGLSDSILRVQQVMAACGKSRSSIYKDMQKGLFPRQVKITARAAGWSRNEIDAWLAQRKQARDASTSL
jgi:prophage regulatory protein